MRVAWMVAGAIGAGVGVWVFSLRRSILADLAAGVLVLAAAIVEVEALARSRTRQAGRGQWAAEQAQLAAEQGQLVAERDRVVAERGQLVAEQALDRARRLQDAAAALGRAVTPRAVGDAIVTEAMAALDADRAIVAELTDRGRGLHLLAARGYPDGFVEHWRDFSAEIPSPMSDAIRTRGPVFASTRSEVMRRWPGLAGKPVTSKGEATLTVPLILDNAVLGALSLGFPGPRTVDEADLTFAATLARQSAIALERARVNEGRERARREAESAVARLMLVSRVSEMLAETTDYPAAFERLAELVVEDLADLCLIDIRVDDGTISRVAAVHRDPAKQHFADALHERYAPSPTGAHPVARVLTTGRPEFSPEMPDAFLKETTRDAEHLRIVRELGFQSFICVPLLARDRISGAITLVSTDPAHRYDAADVDMAREISRRAAVRLDNARLFQREQMARMEAEEARSRLVFLADATRILVSSLDYDVTLSRLADLVIPALADWCVIHLAGDGQRLQTVALAHADPAKVAFARSLQEEYPPDPDAPVGAGHVIRTGRSELIHRIDDGVIEELVSDPKLLEILRGLGLRSSMVVPLAARGMVFGALTLVVAESGRTYGESDLLVAEELGRRAGIAIDNARLYRDRDYIAQTLQRSLLPPRLPDIPGIEMQARYFPLPENEVGGDFYDVFDAGGGAWGIVLGDVCGKGPDAAAVMGVARVTLRTAAVHEARPSEVLRTMSDILISQGTDQRFCTAVYARMRIGEAGARLTLACGGHPLPIVIPASGEASLVGEFGNLLGVLENPVLFDVAVDLAPGDSIVLYTDGLLDERRGGSSGEERLLRVLRSAGGRSAGEIAASLEDYLTANRSELPRDDAAFLVARVLP